MSGGVYGGGERASGLLRYEPAPSIRALGTPGPVTSAHERVQSQARVSRLPCAPSSCAPGRTSLPYNPPPPGPGPFLSRREGGLSKASGQEGTLAV